MDLGDVIRKSELQNDENGFSVVIAPVTSKNKDVFGLINKRINGWLYNNVKDKIMSKKKKCGLYGKYEWKFC